MQPRETVILAGCVVEDSRLLGAREQFTLELAAGARARVSVRLKAGEAPPTLRYGQRMELDGQVRSPRNFRTPGAFDMERALARRQVYWMVSARASEVRLLPGSCGSPALARLHRWRARLQERARRLPGLGDAQRALLAATLLGDASGLEPAAVEPYRRTGTYHALVVSGTHVSAVAGLVLAVLRLGCARPGWRLVFGLAAVWGYAGLVGLQAPVTRAAGGATLLLLGGVLFRRARPVNLLAAVGLAMLAFDPEQLWDASFQLTFLAMAVIVGVAMPWLERQWLPRQRGLRDLSETSRDMRLPPWVASFRVELRLAASTLALASGVPERAWRAVVTGLAWVWFVATALAGTSLLVQLGMVLPMAAYFHRVPLTATVANLVVSPALSLALPLGLVAMAGNHAVTSWPVGLALRLAQAGAEQAMTWEWSERVPGPPIALGVAFAMGLVGWACVVRHAERWRWLAGVGMALLTLALVTHPFAPKTTPGRLELTALDVGQGDGLVVALPQGLTMAVDGGGLPHYGDATPPRLDIGEEVVSPYLWSRSIRRLDVLVCTHAHADHAGGVPALLENFRPRELWVGAMPTGPAWAALRRAAERCGTRIRTLRAGDGFGLSGAEVRVLAPARDYEPGKEPQNDDSLVLRLRHGRHTFLLTGDAEKRTEWQMLDEQALGRVDVLKVAHHGSRTSTTAGFVDATRPAFALVSAGWMNQYRHPHPEVVGRLLAAHATVLRTDTSGWVTIQSDGRRLWAETAEWERAAGAP